jgi:hypothetical protein
MEDRIRCERFERLLEEASDLFEEEDRQEIRRGDQAVKGGMVRGWLVENGWGEREVLCSQELSFVFCIFRCV